MMRASIVIPARNCADTLEAVLDALDRQRCSDEDMEIIVVDDGSVDATPRLLAQRHSRSPLTHLRGEPDGGPWCPGRVRNRGLEQARGEVVIFLDADVVPGPTFVRGHLDVHRSSGAPRAALGYVFGYPLDAARRDPKVLRPPPLDEMIDRLPECLARAPDDWRDGREAEMKLWPDLAGCPWPWNFCLSGNLSVLREQARACGGFDEDFTGWGGEDTEFGFRLHVAGVELSLARAAWGVHYPHPPRARVDDRANLRYFLRKRRDARLELTFWGLVNQVDEQEGLPLGLEVMTVLETATPSDPPSPAVVEALVATLRLGHEGPVLVIGEWPTTSPVTPADHHRPFTRPAGGLLGLALPHADRSFADVVLVDHWRRFSAGVRQHLLREALRVAPRAVLVASDAAAAHGLEAANAIDLPLPSDAVVHSMAIEGARVHVVTRSR
jgi:cellulose synthase/poly-beta-1,6-N-acetylglucosamine synthase-like glycosyltransferase